MSDNEGDCLRGKPPSTQDDGGHETDTAGMSSSEADHHYRSEVSVGRRSKPSSRRRKSKSPNRSISEARQAKSSSSSRVKPRGGLPSRSRSIVDDEDRKSRSGRRHSAEGTPSGEEEAALKAKSTSRDGKASTTKSSASTVRRGRSTASTNTKHAESKGDRDTRNRHRKSSVSEQKEGKHPRGENEQMSSAESFPRNPDSSSLRSHRSKSRSHHDTEKSSRDRSVRSEKSHRSERSASARSSMKVVQEEECRPDSPIFPGATTGDPPSTTLKQSREPSLSLRSSVKVASALVKFRKVLAMSKQASASAQKYRDDQERRDIGIENLGSIDTVSAQKENSKRGSSHHRRERGSASRQSKHGRRKSEHAEISSTRNNRRTNELSSSPNRATQTSSESSRKQEATTVDADAFLKEALSNVGKKLSRSSMTKKEPEAKKGEPAAASAVEEISATAVTEEPAAANANTSCSRESSSAIRLKSSAKVSTAVLKFQQALALSKSATKAAKTQQETQNQLLGEVHSDTKKSDDYLARASLQNSIAASPVSAVDVIDPTQASDSPKVPSDLDGDSDIDSEIEIDDVNEDDDTVSDVATDSEDEYDVVAADTTSDMELEKNAGASVPTTIVSTNSDFDMDSDVDDHSDVDIDSDDDLNSEEELDTMEDGVIPTKGSNSEDRNDSTGHDDSDVAMDSDNTIGSDCDIEAQKGKVKPEMPTPVQSFSDEVEAAGVVVNQNGSAVAAKEDCADLATNGGQMGELSRRLIMSPSLSFNASLNGNSSQSLLDKSLTDWKSSRDLTAGSKGPGLPIRGLSLRDSKASITTEEDSQPALNYLPVSMTKAERDTSPDDYNDGLLPEQEGSLISRRITQAPPSETDASKPSRKDLTRKSSHRSMKKSKSAGDQPVQLAVARKLLGDDSLGRRTRSSSRLRKPPSRSRSRSIARDNENDSQRERKSKSSSSRGDRGKTKNIDRSKGSERSRRRSSSQSRSRTLSGLSSFSQAAMSAKGQGPSSDKREEGRKPSSRRRTPNRAKSHDPTAEHRRPSRSTSGRNAEKDNRDRRSRKIISAAD